MHMKIKVGDTVRFLNISGGGKVTRLEGKLVYIEDQDGFEVPTLMNEVVVIESASNVKPAPETASVNSAKVTTEEVDDDYEYDEEDGDDANPRFFLAVLPGDKPGVDSGDVRLQVVNDSNYFAFYTIANKKKDQSVDLLYHGSVEPNTKEDLAKVPVFQLDDNQWEIQLVLYKTGRSYKCMQPVAESIKIKASRFYKDNAFVDNDYFHEKAVLIPVIKGEFERKLDELTDKEINKVVREKEKAPAKKKYARRNEPGILEVDLHIDELIDSTAGLSNTEILNVQTDKFHQVMAENEKNKGRKVVFIHGVGNGVLKTEIRKLLDRRYKKHVYQDASFKEYGYGATMVII